MYGDRTWSNSSNHLTQQPWQQQIRGMDENAHPPIVTNYLDSVRDLISLSDIVPATRTAGGKIEPIDSPLIEGFMCGFDFGDLSFNGWIARLCRTLLAVGEAYIVPQTVTAPTSTIGVEDQRLIWHIVQTPQIEKRGNMWAFRTRPDQAADSLEWMPSERFCRINLPHPTWDHVAHSNIKGMIPFAANIMNAVEAGGQVVRDPLVVDKILLGNTSDRLMKDDHGNVMDPLKKGYVEAQRSNRRDHPLRGAAWFARDPEADSFKVVDLARNLDPGSPDFIEQNYAYASRVVRWPSILLIEGPGSAKFWNEQSTQHVLLTQDLPANAQPCLNRLSAKIFQPILSQTPELCDAMGIDSKGFLLTVDADCLRVPVDETEKLCKAWREGTLSAEAFHERLGFREDEFIEAPEGLSQFERWAFARSAGGALAFGLKNLFTDDLDFTFERASDRDQIPSERLPAVPPETAAPEPADDVRFPNWF